MPNVKLSPEKVVVIKQLLKKGLYTHLDLANKFGVSRQQITRINVGINNPNAKTARWGHIDENDMSKINSSLKQIINLLSDDEAGKLIKSILNNEV